MSHDAQDLKTIERSLWDEIIRRQTGMLGLARQRDHFQPMTAFAEPETGEIWFFTRDDTDLARSLEDGADAMFVFQSKDLQACLGGELTIRRDPVRIDRYWNAVVAAWYPQGKDDPHLTLLRLRARDAEVWVSDGGPLKFAWEIAKANATHRLPDVGEHARVDLH